jgi:TonB family protein
VDIGGVVRIGRPCASTNLKGQSCQLKPTGSENPLILEAEMRGAAPPQPVTKASWLKTPNGDDMLEVYPSKAFANGLAGQATLVCQVDASGSLKDCFVIDESPAGYGFGDAALKLSSKFRLKPPFRNGVPVGGRMTIPIRFALGR